jgi:AraC-like DNA-binding protein
VGPYRALFKVTPRFNSEVCALRFRNVWMKRPVQGADPERLRAAQQQVEHAGPPDLLQQVYRTLRRLLMDDRHCGDDVARMLAVHRRTLNRRLRARGTTFQEVLDQLRFAVARELLAMNDIALDDVAAALGYAGVSPFLRTFQRWAGTSPGRWRHATAMSRSGDNHLPRMA